MRPELWKIGFCASTNPCVVREDACLLKLLDQRIWDLDRAIISSSPLPDIGRLQRFRWEAEVFCLFYPVTNNRLGKKRVGFCTEVTELFGPKRGGIRRDIRLQIPF